MPDYNLMLPNGILKRISKACAVLLKETRVLLTEDGMNIRAVDSGNICLVDVALPKQEFEKYEVVDSAIGVDVRKLYNGIKGELFCILSGPFLYPERAEITGVKPFCNCKSRW